MTFNLIASQGRVADRTDRTLKGAALVARALENRFGLRATSVGQPDRAAADPWTDSLSRAGPTLEAVGKAVSSSLSSGRPTVLVSNTCAVSLASLPEVARRFPDAALLWIDAHGDFHTPDTTRSGYLGGMVLAAACGLWDSGYGAGMRADRTVLAGVRDMEPEEEEAIRRAGAVTLPPAVATPEAVLETLGGRDVWIHIDWDVLEPGHVPADYHVPGGLRPEQVRTMLAALPPTRVLGLELAEYLAPVECHRSEAEIATIMDMVTPFLARL